MAISRQKETRSRDYVLFFLCDQHGLKMIIVNIISYIFQCHQLGVIYYHNVARYSGALPMLLPVVRFRTPLGAELSDKYHVSPFSIFGYCFDVVSVGKALYPYMLHLTYV